MRQIAEMIKHVVIDGRDPAEVRAATRELRLDYQKVGYCFDAELGAYEYVRLR